MIKLANLGFGPCIYIYIYIYIYIFVSIQTFLKLLVLVSTFSMFLLTTKAVNGVPLHLSYVANLINLMYKNPYDSHVSCT